MMKFSGKLSLLSPKECPVEVGTRLSQQSIRDLGLTKIVHAISPNHSYHRAIERILLQLSHDPQVIRYRQDIFEDLLAHPNLVAGFEKLLPLFRELSPFRYRRDAKHRSSILYEVIWRTRELSSLIDCVDGLAMILQEAGDQLRSEGLRRLQDEILAMQADESFQHLIQELPEILAQLQSVKSVTIGVNLDHHFQPVEATLLSINTQKFSSISLLSRLFGKNSESMEGIAPIHSVPSDLGQGPKVTPMMMPLFQDVAKVLEKVCQPIAKALQRYMHITGAPLLNLGAELGFYLGAVRLISRIRESGLPMCKPELLSQKERICEIKDNFNLHLALHLLNQSLSKKLGAVVVKNDVVFGARGRIMILTGPNRGGKTTYIQAVGLTQVLMQAGLYVPGTNARMSLVDNIYTHFPNEEQFEQGTGRFGDEAKRFQEIFAVATRHSLLLLNESLSSTSPGESVYLAQDILRILKLLGVRAIFATHLHELAAGIEEFNASTPGDSEVISMIASFIDETALIEAPPDTALQRSYKVIPGPPMGRSYAHEIARRYGVSFEQLQATLNERGVL